MKGSSIKRFATLVVLLPLFMLFSCGRHLSEGADSLFQPDTSFSAKYAKLFKIGRVHGHRAVLVVDPWDSTRVWGRYMLIQRKEKISLPKGYIPVYQPVRTVATTSSTLFSHLQGLGCLNRLTGVSDTAYIINPLVKLRIRKKLITEIGVGNQIHDEQLIACDPDLAFFSLFSGLNFGKYETVGIKVLPLADYLEASPLGRAEWIKFTGIFLGKEKEADSLFKEIETNYLKMKDKALQASTRPQIFDGMMDGSTWYVSAARSYMACLYKDAGLDYVFGDKEGTASVPLGFEEILNRTGDADYWRILKGGTELNDRNDLLKIDLRYQFLGVFRKGKILYCNVSQVPLYEEGNSRPDLILADLLFLTHPDLNPGYQPVYYQLLP